MAFSANINDLKHQQQYDAVFPLLIQADDQADLNDACQWLTANRAQLLEQLDMHGAVLLRGFPAVNAGDFDAVVRSFQLPNFRYAESLSNAVRINRTERVFTANEAPPEVSIYLHHEMAQTPVYPSRLFFFCEKAAERDGETPICRSDVLLDQLREQIPDFVEACETLGVKYTNVMPGADDPQSGQGRSWRSTLGTDTTQAAEERLRALGYTWEWRSGETLAATTPVLPAVSTLADGRKVFFNQLIAAFRGWADSRNNPQKSIRFGNNEPISVDDMDVAIRLADQLTFDLAWQTGDVVMIDNFTVMHGRRPFQGTRKVLASLIADDHSRLAQAK